MTPEQRRHEIASLLANGLARLRVYSAKKSAYIPEASEFDGQDRYRCMKSTKYPPTG